MARKRRFPFRLPTVLARRPSVGRVGLDRQWIWSAALGRA